MTKQQTLQIARDVITGKQSDSTRTTLKTAAVSEGRSVTAVSKASTMRLALWVTSGASAI
jgi:hypothetical protein